MLRGAPHPQLAGLLLLGLLYGVVLARYAPPEPLGADAPPERFAAGRARARVAEIVGDGGSRWMGTADHDRARDRIAGALAELGYAPEIQRAVACSRWGACAAVENVVGRREGRLGGHAVLVTAHYDSVKAGPGAGDDASGVAVALEAARVLAAAPPARNSLIVLLTDGEEAGLLGAEAFARHHRWASEVRLVVNVEARGSSGPSLMFETGPGTGAFLPHFARAARRPVTGSLFATVYERLPNDTDLTVFRRRGLPGFNFAFLGEATTYHTARDTLDRLDPGSLQHHGDQVLALLERLLRADLGLRPAADPVFFDLLAWRIAFWPAGWTLPLALLALGGVGATVLVGWRRCRLGARAVGLGLVAGIGMIGGGAAVVVLATLVFRALGAFPPPWSPFTPHPLLQASLAAAALAGTSAVAALLARRAGFWGLWAGTWLGWAGAGLALALALPGGSYLFIVPALVAGAGGLGAALAGSEGLGRASDFLAVVAAGCLWLPLLSMLDDALGSPGLPVVGLAFALFTSSLAPLAGNAAGRARWALPAAAALALGMTGLAALILPPRVEPPPERLTVFQEAGGEARWLMAARGRSERPGRLAEARAPFGPGPEACLPWGGGAAGGGGRADERAFAAPAPGISLPAPELADLSTTEEGGRRTFRGRLVSARGAREASLRLPASLPLSALRLGGEPVPFGEGPLRRRPGAWRTFAFYGLPAGGVEVELAVDSAEPFEAWVSDESLGLPAGVASPLPPVPAGAGPPDRVSTVAARTLRLGAGQ